MQGVLQPRPGVAAESEPDRRQFESAPADRDHLPDRVRGQPAHHREQVVGRGRHPAAHAEDERELETLRQQALVAQPQARLQTTRVVDLQFRQDAEVAHPRGEPPHAVGRVQELTGAERRRARVERGHPRPEFDELGPFLEQHVETDSGRELDEDRAPLCDQLHHTAPDAEIGGRPPSWRRVRWVRR
nr:hypothetical protein [Umezawaea beigongshangensis]